MSEPTQASERPDGLTLEWIAEKRELLASAEPGRIIDHAAWLFSVPKLLDLAESALKAEAPAPASVAITRKNVADLLEIGRPSETGGPYIHQVDAAIAFLHELWPE